ncbi:MAG: bifunctional glutamate N-acetyltransferase/amino-acid acetyltransferase ArgJ [Lentisphaerae bacterium]|nr:bifunctional glutamate N-acetyltransferase/amino-acid acetyltransferase ArgJ [Lentisphaerota bacterium]
MKRMKKIDGGITAAKGYRAAGIHAGIKGPKADMALIVSDAPAAAAGVFTSNKIKGAVVKLCMERIIGGVAQAIIVNSGNANACTGEQGMKDAVRMGQLVADLLHIQEDKVFVSSTGTIGVPMPMGKIERGINLAVEALSETGGDAAAKAIMTTDTKDKQVAFEREIGGVTVRIGGMAKGAGMIEPNMATMLSFITTDAAVKQTALQSCLSAAVEQSFNKISVDGDQSCNDTVLILANGMAGNKPLDESHPDWPLFVDMVNEITLTLARKIVEDGEGATKFVMVSVVGAASPKDARKAVRSVANSLLVKTSWFGEDPNWGRVIDAVGYSGAEVVENQVDIMYDDVSAVKNGQVAAATALSELENVLKKRSFSITINLNIGKYSDWIYTCDCSKEYVQINSEYMT